MRPTLENRRARHDYEVLETYEAGIALKGTEVVRLPEVRRGFVLLPRRWVVEGSFGRVKSYV